MDPKRAIASPKKDKYRSIKVVAMIRVTTKYLNGLVPETSIASTNLQRMDPSSAPIPEPMRPAQIKAVIGPISELSKYTMDGIHDTPNSRRVGRLQGKHQTNDESSNGDQQ
jgi:hypothetical protein